MLLACRLARLTLRATSYPTDLVAPSCGRGDVDVLASEVAQRSHRAVRLELVVELLAGVDAHAAVLAPDHAAQLRLRRDRRAPPSRPLAPWHGSSDVFVDESEQSGVRYFAYLIYLTFTFTFQRFLDCVSLSRRSKRMKHT